DPVGNVLPQGDRDRCQLACQKRMRMNVIGMRGFLDEQRLHLAKLTTHFQGTRRRPLLDCIEHDQRFGASEFTKHMRSANIAASIEGTDLQLERMKSAVDGLSRQIFDALVVILKPSDGRIVSGIASSEDALSLRARSHILLE